MKALVYHGTRDLRYEEFPEPDRLQADSVRIRVKYSGICHTDFNEWASGPIFVASTPHPRTGRSIPIVLGHEFSGEVVETGSGVGRLKTGDLVAVNSVDPCGICPLCRAGAPALCRDAAFIGFSHDGGYAEFAAVPEACCHLLRPNVSPRAGALCEPLAVAAHGVRLAKIPLGARAVVVGCGTIGLCTLQVLRTSGARDVLVVEPSKAKKPVAEQLGASAFLVPGEIDVARAVLDRTDGLGADFCFECVGSRAAFQTAVELTRPGGTVCVLGVYPQPFQTDWNAILGKEKTVMTSLAYSQEDFETVIALLNDGRLQAEPLITRTVAFREALDSLTRFEEFRATNVKTLIDLTA